MFKKRDEIPETANLPAPTTRVTSVLGSGIAWKGAINGSGGVRVEGAFDGDINLRGMLVVGQTGRVSCDNVRANVVIVAGALRGDITAEKVEIRSTGRVWGDVVTAAFATEEGAFLRGQIRMEESIEIELPADGDTNVDALEESEIETETQEDPEED
ncbi:MAG: polymer-forming cytoskeletal protein [Anaerolineales bacterium]|nr:polymer-forming cytoskeletal protein [Chloroflexota bacterium]MBL6981101.1 polymer-forming cytoskeletal protein [Anaerolineales bacterium]